MLLSRLVRQSRSSGRNIARSFFRKSVELETGIFGNELLKSPSGFKELNRLVRENCAKIVTELEKGRTDRTTVQLLDDLSNELCKGADLVDCVRQLHPDSKFAEAAEESSRDFCNLLESLNTYTVLYEKLKNSKKLEASRLNVVDNRTIDLLLYDFEQSGVHLPQEEREAFVNLSSDIFDTSCKFQWGCDRDVQIGRGEKKQYGLSSMTLTSPISHSSDRNVRKFIYGSFYKHNDEQEALLRHLVAKRHELAQLTGFESFAHRSQHNSLLGTYENTQRFLWGVVEACRPAAERELAVLMDVQGQCESSTNTVAEWDIHFLTHLYKEQAFGRSHLKVAGKYLRLGNLIQGFCELVTKLYGIRLESAPIKSGEIWSESIIKLAAIDGNDNLLGHIYLDVESRPSKAVGDCHYTIRCSKQLEDQSWQTPIVLLSLALVNPSTKDWQNVQISLQSAENLFHELGHAMHSMLGRTQYQHVAGTRCPQDFSEIPSNLMEYFFNDIQVMRSMLRCPQGEPIAVEDAAVLISSRFAFTSLETIQNAIYAIFDLELHGPEAIRIAEGNFTTTELLHRIADVALPSLQRDPRSAPHHRLHHLVQYGAKYYSYLVARSAACLIWNSVFQPNPFSAEAGRHWAEVQSYGGGLPPALLLKTVLGYTPTEQHLVNALKSETGHASNLSAVNI